MKTALFIATPGFPEVKYVHLYRDTVDKNIALAADQGFEAVELLISDPDVFDVPLLKSSLKESNIDLACVNTGQLFTVMGLRLIHEDKKIMETSLSKLKKCIDIAAEIGCFVGIGLFRGPCIPDKPIQYSKDIFVDVLKYACSYAKEKGTGLSFEPTNRFEINFINTTIEGMEIVNRVGMDNLGMTLDTYHIYLEDRNILESITMARDCLKHMHFSDSDRWPAGLGHGEIDFASLIRVLYAVGYNGYLTEGLIRYEGFDKAARTTAAFLKRLVREYK